MKAPLDGVCVPGSLKSCARRLQCESAKKSPLRLAEAVKNWQKTSFFYINI
jgi:hypothetical protein